MTAEVFRPGVSMTQTDGSLTFTDADGTVRQVLGAQADGTITSADYNGPPPGTPSTPVVTPAQLALSVAWDGELVSSTDGPPLNDNTDFEAGVDPWTTDAGQIAASTTQAHAGAQSLAITPDGSSAVADAISELCEAVAGQTYEAAGWVWATDAVTGQFSLSVDFYDENQQYLSTATNLVDLPAATWTEVTNTVTAPAGAAFQQLHPTLCGTPTHVFYLDDVTLSAATASVPVDFDHVEVHVSTADGFTPDATTRQGTLPKAGAFIVSPLIAGTTYYARLIGVNTSGNPGPASAQASGIPEEVVASDIADGIVTTVKLADDAVTNAKIAGQAVDGTKLADGSVDAAKVVAGAIGSSALADGSVLAAKLADGSVSTAKLADGSVNGAKILDGSIGTAEINFNARALGGINTTIAGAAPTSPAPIDGDIWIDSNNGYRVNRYNGSSSTWVAVQYGTGALAANSVTSAIIAAGQITASHIAAGTITGDRLAANTITATQIAAGAIGATQIAANAIVAGNIAAGAIGATQLAANSVIAGKIAAGTVDTTALAANAVTAAKIAAGTITASQIAANTITAAQIAAGTITAAQIAAGTIDASKLAATLVLASQFIAGSPTGARVTFDQYGINAYDGTHTDPTVSITNLGNAFFNGASVSASVGNFSSIEIDAASTGALIMYGITGSPVNANPNFTGNINSWTLPSGMSGSWSSTQQYQGHNTMRLVGTGSDPAYVTSELFTIVTGDTYTLEVAALCETGMNLQAILELDDATGSNVYASDSRFIPTPRGKFQVVSFSVSGIGSETRGRIKLAVSGGTNAVYVGKAAATLVDPAQVFSLASVAGTDQNGNAYPAGLAANVPVTAGNINNAITLGPNARLVITVSKSLPSKAYYVVVWDAAALDNANGWSSANHTRYVCPRTGWYEITLNANMNAAGARLICGLQVNGTRIAGRSIGYSPATVTTASYSMLLRMNAGDYLEAWVYNDDTAAHSMVTNSDDSASLNIAFVQ